MPHHDPAFPGLHIRPASGWVNDPNGVSLIDGRYHVFFQYNPDSPLHGSIRWGHASSDDLVSWRYEPVALHNRPGSIDAAGCWSGCVVDDHGVPTAVYTAVQERAGDAVVTLARSDRSMIDWQQSDHGVTGPPSRPGVTEVRDPYVFSHGGHRYAVQGAGAPGGEPVVLLYGCDDLERWTELGALLEPTDPVAREIAPAGIWECPNLFPLDDRWVLLVSCWRRGELEAGCYLVGDLEPVGAGLVFRPESGGRIDDGAAFYAPQVLRTADRALLWGWARDLGRNPDDVLGSGWSGALTFPRELSLADGVLTSVPPAELEALRGSRLRADRPITEPAFEVRGADGIRLSLITAELTELVVDEPGPVRVLVDGSLVEVFPTGRTARTVRAYPVDGSSWLVEAGGDPMVTELVAPAADRP